MIGQTILHYRITEKPSTGRMGTSYKSETGKVNVHD
jgi:hypothetical protein